MVKKAKTQVTPTPQTISYTKIRNIIYSSKFTNKMTAEEKTFLATEIAEKYHEE